MNDLFLLFLPLRWKSGILGLSCQLCALDLEKDSFGLQQVQYSKFLLLIFITIVDMKCGKL